MVILATFIKEFEMPRLKSCSKYMSVLFICVILYFFLRDYLTPYAGSSMRYIDQYYPYHSIFDPVVEYERQNYFQL